jgi:hypothetical protein
MTRDLSAFSSRLPGEQSRVVEGDAPAGAEVDSWAGSVRVEWDQDAAMTPLGQLPFFVDFLKTSGLFDAFVPDCPLRYQSPNAPKRRDVLGTTMLSMLAGHKRYAHIAALRCDAVLPELLGMEKIVSEDTVRRGLKAIDEEEGAAWLRRHLDHCVGPLLNEPRILDIDTTIKPLYGHQEGAEVGYNPKKPGRPSHCYQQLRDGAPATSTRPNTARRGCGRCWIACRAIAGRRFCAATPTLASSRSWPKPRRKGCPICSNCG